MRHSISMSQYFGKAGLLLNDFLFPFGKTLLSIEGVKNPIYRKISHIRKENRLWLHYGEAAALYFAAQESLKISGDMAEVGVYTGGSAKLLCEAKKTKQLHLFDTFSGLPQPSSYDRSFQKGQYKTSLDEVRQYLNAYSNVHFYTGNFPVSGNMIRNKRFCFVHLDVDLYQSTIDALHFFYPRMNRGGIIMSHDFGKYHNIGVTKAIQEFFRLKPEPILLTSGSECAIVKL